MIHYHGTPVSGPAGEAARFLQGRHGLVSYAYQADMEIVAEVCQSFVLDNGAFTVWRQGGQLDVPGYIRWCERWHRHPGFDWALIPDIIDGDEQANDDMLALWPNHIRGVPVWHMHESLDRLVRLATFWPVVALGSSGQWDTPGTTAWWDRMGLAMDAICDEHGRPPCRLHGLRMLAPDVFTKLPLSSADSTNAAVNAGSISRFGMYPAPAAGTRAAVIADRIEIHNSAPCWISHGVQGDLF